MVNAKGGKFLPLKRPTDWLRIIWHPSSFGGEQRRVNLCLKPGEGGQEFFGNVERVKELARKSIHDMGTRGYTAYYTPGAVSNDR